ncbi:MAG TPA: hypothetical protein VEP90_21770 [Methylomirabilota bacterium]|nr:hypothetical protein [Methylomirabilota bacterium]
MRIKKKSQSSPVGIPTTPALNLSSKNYDYNSSTFGLGSKKPPKPKRKPKNGSNSKEK